MKRKLILGFSIPLLLLFVGFAILYTPDKNFEELKNKYSYPDSQFLNMDGMQVHYRINGSGKTLVLLHGTSSSLNDWEKWIDIFSKKYRVVSVDLPGFGLTGPNTDGKYDRTSYLNFLNNFFQETHCDSFILCGNSFGGYLAWNYTLNHPEQVEQLVMLNPSGAPLDVSKMPIGFRLMKSPGASLFMKYITPYSVVQKTSEKVFSKPELADKAFIDRHYDLLLREGNREALIKKSAQITHDNFDDIAKIKCPTLLIWGDQDFVLPVGDAALFHEKIAHSELIIYPNVGHIPMIEIAEKSAADVESFLAKNDTLFVVAP